MVPPTESVALDTSRERVTAALLYAAARFAPLPLLDDILRAQVATWMVARAVAARSPSIPRSHVAPLGEDSRGLLHGCLGALLRLPLAIVLFPIRKIAAVVFGVRNFARDVLEVVLLGRVVDRALADGTLRPDRAEAEQRAVALRLRGAFDRAFVGTDLSALRAALVAAKVPLREVVPAAMRWMRAARRGGAEVPAAALGDGTLGAESERVAGALHAPEVQAALRAFDDRMAAELGEGR